MKKPDQWQITVVLLVGITGVSLAAIWIRLANSAVNLDNKIGFSLFLAGSRLIIAALILLPTWTKIKIKSAQINVESVYYALAAGICLAVHFATWITSLAYTSIAASTVLVTTNPIWVGLFSWWWYKEKLNRQNTIGIAMALTGGIIIAIADSKVNGSYSNPILGDILALIGALMSSLYIIFGSQAQKQGLKTSSYIAIAYSTAAIFLFPLPLLYNTSYLNHTPLVYLYVLLMAIISQLIGHTSLNWAVRWISPTLISLSLLFEPVIASFIGAIIFQEIPSLSLLFGGLIILMGIAVFIKE